MDKIEFNDVELIFQDRKVIFEYIGEGYFGDFDPHDPADVALLRFSCFKRDDKKDESDWEELPDSSYCTELATGTHMKLLFKAMAEIMEAIQDVNYKRRLEELSHLCYEDLLK